jgi:DNA-nicking Smr family endonuclease
MTKKDKKSKNKTLSEDDIKVWQELASSVEPISKDDEDKYKTLPDKKNKTKSLPKQKKQLFFQKPDNKKLLSTSAQKSISHGDVENIDRKTAQNFIKGKMKIEAKLDMHGLTENQAYQKLCSFIENAYQRQKRCVLIITGKGKKAQFWYEPQTGILKTAVPKWLNQPPLRNMVLSFSYANRFDGGDGALYVLIKRKRS